MQEQDRSTTPPVARQRTAVGIVRACHIYTILIFDQDRDRISLVNRHV